jgi:hypothetical protein
MKVVKNRLGSDSSSELIQQLNTSNKGGLITPNYILIRKTKVVYNKKIKNL